MIPEGRGRSFFFIPNPLFAVSPKKSRVSLLSLVGCALSHKD